MGSHIKIESETVKKIKAAFPRPKTVNASTDNISNLKGQYCVLGAVYRYVREYFPDVLLCTSLKTKAKGESADKFLDSLVYSFPGGRQAVKLLTQLNCALPEDEALNFACSVTDLNDSGKFGQAWQKLSEALTYKPVDQTKCN